MRADLGGVDPLVTNLAQRCSVGDILGRAAAQFPLRTALVANGFEYSYADLEARANRLGRGLLGLAATRQEPVAILAGNDAAFVEVFFACAKTGRVALPINLALGEEEIAFILRDSGARVVVAKSRFVPTLEEVLPGLEFVADLVVIGDGGLPRIDGVAVTRYADLLSSDPSPVECIVEDRDIAHCLYTSGTTGAPKGVLTSHVAVLVAVLSSALQLGHRRGEQSSVQPIVLPLFHTTGIDVLMLPTLLVGGTVVLFDGFDAPSLLDAIERRRATHVLLLPAMWAQLLGERDIGERDTSSMTLCMYAMAPMPTERIDRIQEAFPNASVLLGSGQTELTPPTVMQWPPHQQAKPSSWGPPLATTDVRIMDPEGTLVQPGIEGEIVYRGPQCMAGYWNQSEANARVFAHGWMHSGDMGWIDEDGVVWFTDRLKDIVKTGGENVSSVEVERVLLGHPKISDCAVIAVPHPRWGEAVTAVIVSDPAGLAANDVITYCRAHLAGFKTPKAVVFVADLPRTATGKIQKHLVRRQLQDETPAEDRPHVQ